MRLNIFNIGFVILLSFCVQFQAAIVEATHKTLHHRADSSVGRWLTRCFVDAIVYSSWPHTSSGKTCTNQTNTRGAKQESQPEFSPVLPRTRTKFNERGFRRVATRPDFSGTSWFPAWMSRVPARPRSGRLCPDFLYKDKGVRERTLYKMHNLLLLLLWPAILQAFLGSSPCSSTSIHTQHSLQRIFLTGFV